MPFELVSATVCQGDAPKHPTEPWRPFKDAGEPAPISWPKKPKQVLLTLPAFGGTGVSSWVETMCAHMDRKHWIPNVWADQAAITSIDRLRELGVNVIVPRVSITSSGENSYQQRTELLMDWPVAVDIVQNSISDLAVDVASFHGVPVIETIHGWSGALKLPYKDKLSGIVAVSDICWGPYVRLPNVPTSLIPNGVDTEYWKRVDEEVEVVEPRTMLKLRFDMGNDLNLCKLDIDKNKKNIVWAGRFTVEKGPDMLYNIVRSTSHIPDLHFWIAADTLGNPDLVAGLNAMPNCSCLGFLPKDTLRALYSQCDIYLSTSKHEGMSMAMLEAMACECFPIVAAAAGDTIERLGIGNVISSDVPQAYIEAIQEAPDDCGKDGRAAVVKNFGAEKMVTSYGHFWSYILGGKRLGQSASSQR